MPWLQETDYLQQLADWKHQYERYIRSDAWQARRQRALRHAKYRCVICHSTRGLQVHHASYDNLFHEPLSDLVVLCKTCHELFHKHKRLAA